MLDTQKIVMDYIKDLNEGMKSNDFSKAIARFSDESKITVDSRSQGRYYFREPEQIEKFHSIFLKHPAGSKIIPEEIEIRDEGQVVIVDYVIRTEDSKPFEVEPVGKISFDFNKEGRITSLMLVLD